MATTQEGRRFAVTAPNGDADLLLFSEMTAEESISGLFRIRLTCVSEKSDIAFEDMIGGALSIKMNLPKDGDVSERYFHGVVSRFAQGPPIDRFITYHMEVVPWLWLLTRGSDCRIFQHMTTPDIIKQVFDDLGMSDYKLELTGQYSERDYTVQYRETHFDFVCRLMEEAGIAYYFEHGEKEHTLMLFDDPSANPATPYSKQASYATEEDGDRPAGEIEDWTVEHVFPTGKFAITDYDESDPGRDLGVQINSNIDVGGNDRFEIYDYPGQYVATADGDTKARLRMEAEEAQSYRIRGRSARGDFGSGCKFDLVGHYRADFDQTYLIHEVTHQARQGYGRDSAGASYSNTFQCIPHSVPFRPLQTTPKPIISGAQTATVVGADGEEIDVDEQGRVVVKFHWDRAEGSDEKSSCRVRVSQASAGKGFGAVLHPRIGQEVIVEFLEGDPDRPIVTGRVYNGEQTLPFDLPSEKTQSGVKTKSTKDGANDNFNEIRFEDKKGSELVYIQAEKDQNILVKNDKSEDVGNDESVKVGNDRTASVGNDENIQINNDRMDAVSNNETRSVGKVLKVDVGEDQSVTVGANRTVDVGKDETTKVAGDQTVEVEKNQQIKISKSGTIEIAEKLLIDVGKEIIIKTGKAQLIMKKDGSIVLAGKDIGLKASGKVNVKASGDVILKGSKVTSN
jgi:type VI secretion system secreted protein VgrG